ncbi:MAG TPA: RNA methyltransferase [Candidatus Woesebacteria bacterium]|nr:RNA methyltransferase [Candidatus Woesebacteria bacterium]
MELDRQEKIRNLVDNRQTGIIVLEDVWDPHNIQAVVRTADGLGFGKIYLIFEKEKEFDPKVVGKASSSSANKWVEYKIFRSSKECFEELKKDGYEIVVSVLDKQAKEASKTDLTAKKIALVMGNEHKGVSETAKLMADKKIYIPMKGMVESFNISVASALLMYEVNKQREQSNISYGLEEEEKEVLVKKLLWQY